MARTTNPVFQGTELLPGSRVRELLESKDPSDQKKAKRLHEYARKASACNYDYETVQKLRKEFNDVL